MIKKILDKRNIEIILLICIIIFAFFIRIYHISYPPLWIDESTSAMASRMIIEKGVMVFDSGFNYNVANFFHYVQAGFMLIFGIKDFSVRIFSVLMGIGIIILSYFIGKEYFKSSGIICALFMSVFYLEVFYSRQGRFYQLFQLLFFLTLYLLYKSSENRKHETLFLGLSLLCFFLAIDTHTEGLILAPFMIIFILLFNKNKFLAIIPAIPLARRFFTAIGFSTGSTQKTINYAKDYYFFANNMLYLLIFFVPGAIVAFLKKKKLTLMLLIPSIALLLGVFSLKIFAVRYCYFFVFPLILFSSLLFSYLYEKYGKIIIIVMLAALILPANIVSPYVYVNIIKPVDYNFNDYSAPYTDYKNLPVEIKDKLKDENNTLIALFSSDVEWYIRKPDYVIPFTMDGFGDDEISFNTTDENGKSISVDRYSGALILNKIPNKPYYVCLDNFSYQKLKDFQIKKVNELTKGCKLLLDKRDLRIFECV